MMDPAMMGAPQAAPVDPAVEQVIKKFLEQLRAAVSADGQTSEAEKLLVEQMTTIGQKFLANREKEDQAALGGGGALNAVARALGGPQ